MGVVLLWSLACCLGVVVCGSVHIGHVVDVVKLIISQCSHVQLEIDVVPPLGLSHLVHLELSALLSALQTSQFHVVDAACVVVVVACVIVVGVDCSVGALLVHLGHVDPSVRLTF